MMWLGSAMFLEVFCWIYIPTQESVREVIPTPDTWYYFLQSLRATSNYNSNWNLIILAIYFLGNETFVQYVEFFDLTEESFLIIWRQVSNDL